MESRNPISISNFLFSGYRQSFVQGSDSELLLGSSDVCAHVHVQRMCVREYTCQVCVRMHVPVFTCARVHVWKSEDSV